MENEITFKGTLRLHVSDMNKSILGDNLKLKNIHAAIAHMFVMDHENEVTKVYKNMSVIVKQNIPQRVNTEMSFRGTFFLHKTDINESAIGSGFQLPYAHRAIAGMLSSNGREKDMQIYYDVEIVISQKERE